MASMHHAKSKSQSKDKADNDPSSVCPESPSDEYMSQSEMEAESASKSGNQYGAFPPIKKIWNETNEWNIE